MTDHTLDPFATLDKTAAGPRAAALVPHVELCFHSELSRIGAALCPGQLLPGVPLTIGRQHPLFQQGLETPAALDDPCISREQLSVGWLAAEQRFVVRPTSAARRSVELLDAELEPLGEVERVPPGTWLAIGDRALLHLTLHPASAEGISDTLGMVGTSPAMVALRNKLRPIAQAEGTVLISGESGVGKELVASALHHGGPRRERRFLAVNCAAIPESLLESELFGHVRGAFTGATQDKQGFFRAVDGGTLFLDEIGELPAAMQGKLLRVLQERRVCPVGAQTEIPIDARVIAATNRDLRAELSAGRFRDDLFYRLATLTVDVPPLRERRPDIPQLFVHFLALHGESHHGLERLFRPASQHPPPIPLALFKRLLRSPWPGNVRQLRNVVERLAVANAQHDGPLLIPDEVLSELEVGAVAAEPTPPSAPAPSPHNDGLDEARLLAALEEHAYVQRRVARALGVSHTTIDRWMRELGLRRPRDIPQAELQALAEALDHDVDAMAKALRVSRRGLDLRLTALGLRPADGD